ncbi:MAG: proton-conducting transporter membrane subunit [Micrococcus sp.]|nr:proton-conducting transporter membrane subunit [Micrococcus sp.]
MSASLLLPVLVLLPLFAAALTVLVPATARAVIGVVTSVLLAACAIPVLVEVAGGEPVEAVFGGYAAPVGIVLRADGIGAAFLLLSVTVGLILTLFAALAPSAVGRTGPERRGFWPLWLGAISGVHAVVLSADLFNLYVGLELVSLSAVALVALGGSAARRAALRYLFIAMLGSLLMLVGAAAVVSATGTLDLTLAAETVRENPDTHAAAVLALTLISVGMALKMALFPFHAWLVPAHSGAPTAVSPLLSALVLKAALVVILRVWILGLGVPLVEAGQDPDLATADGPVVAVGILAWTLAGLGVAALILGGVAALVQTRLKPLIAYSTVAQVGYWLLLLPVLVDPGVGPDGAGVTGASRVEVLDGVVAGAVLLALGHGVAKAGMFLGAGWLKQLRGTDELRALRGASSFHPALTLALGLCAVGLAGMPLSLGFSGKWLLGTAGVAGEHYWLLVVIAISTLLSAAYLVRAIGPMLLGAETAAEEDRAEADGADADHSSDDVDPDDEDSQAYGSAGQDPAAWGVGAEAGTTRLEARWPGRIAGLAPLALGTLTVATGLLGSWLAELIQVGLPW